MIEVAVGYGPGGMGGPIGQHLKGDRVLLSIEPHHIEVILTPEEAKKIARWLSDTADLLR